MSYSIFYRAMFIKMSNGTYIPMIESGDNNVWEADRRRRAREWSSCRWRHESEEQRRLYALAERDILSAAQRQVDITLERHVGVTPPFGGEPYTKEQVLADLWYFSSLKIYGRSTTSAAAFLNFFKSGIRNAVTMDDVRGGLSLSWYERGVDNKSSQYRSIYVKDEEDLEAKWKECQEKGITPWIVLSEGVADDAWLLVKNRARKPRTMRPTPNEYFLVAFNLYDTQNFVVKITSRHLQYNLDKRYAHKYASRKVAENAVANISRRFKRLTDIRVERVSAH